jgi:hypothetical protein
MARNPTLLSSAAALALALAAPASAGDLLLAQSDANPLTSSNVGKPFWSLEAQCAGIFGAGYSYEQARGKSKAAEADKQTGVAMLDAAIARLQIDRGLDRNAAMALATREVDYGRGQVAGKLAERGKSSDSQWNLMRSACLDIDAAARLHL